MTKRKLAMASILAVAVFSVAAAPLAQDAFAAGGVIYGDTALSKLFMGSGGGGFYNTGGNGGGIIYMLANTVSAGAGISANGANGASNATGAGAGGSVYITGVTLTLNTNVTATGGTALATGGAGRIYLKSSGISGTTNPVATTAATPVVYNTPGTYTSGILSKTAGTWATASWAITGLELGTSCGNPITDSRDGKTYNTVTIGGQCWLAKNMDVGTKLASAATVPSNDSAIEKWCYDNSDANCNTNGGLYTWAEANGLAASCNAAVCTPPTPNQGICPTGWHIPTDAEYKTLEMQLGMTQVEADAIGARGTNQGTQLKSGGSSGFNGLLSGNRYDSSFNSIGSIGCSVC